MWSIIPAWKAWFYGAVPKMGRRLQHARRHAGQQVHHLVLSSHHLCRQVFGGEDSSRKRLGRVWKHPVINSFLKNSISVRRADGSLVTTGVSPYPAILHGYAISGHWDDATKLCRFVKDQVLWACLAGMAVHARHLDTAEVAYAAIQEADKVYYIQYIKELPLKEARAAEMAVMTGHYQDAENMLLQAGLTFRAILLNIHLQQWTLLSSTRLMWTRCWRTASSTSPGVAKRKTMTSIFSI